MDDRSFSIRPHHSTTQQQTKCNQSQFPIGYVITSTHKSWQGDKVVTILGIKLDLLKLCLCPGNDKIILLHNNMVNWGTSWIILQGEDAVKLIWVHSRTISVRAGSHQQFFFVVCDLSASKVCHVLNKRNENCRQQIVPGMVYIPIYRISSQKMAVRATTTLKRAQLITKTFSIGWGNSL